MLLWSSFLQILNSKNRLGTADILSPVVTREDPLTQYTCTVQCRLHFICWPDHTKCPQDNNDMLLLVLFSCKSTYCRLLSFILQSLYPIVFQPVLLPGATNMTLQTPVRCNWTDLSKLWQPIRSWIYDVKGKLAGFTMNERVLCFG